MSLTCDHFLAGQLSRPSLEVFEEKICLTPKGVTGFLTQGLKGTKTIPYYAITGIQFKRSGMISGYLQFTVPGGNEGSGGVFDAIRDENTFAFAGNNDEVLEIKEFIEKRIFELRKPSAPSAQPSGSGMAHELKQLAELKEQGILSEDEFLAAKKRIIG